MVDLNKSDQCCCFLVFEWHQYCRHGKVYWCARVWRSMPLCWDWTLAWEEIRTFEAGLEPAFWIHLVFPFFGLHLMIEIKSCCDLAHSTFSSFVHGLMGWFDPCTLSGNVVFFNPSFEGFSANEVRIYWEVFGSVPRISSQGIFIRWLLLWKSFLLKSDREAASPLVSWSMQKWSHTCEVGFNQFCLPCPATLLIPFASCSCVGIALLCLQPWADCS